MVASEDVGVVVAAVVAAIIYFLLFGRQLEIVSVDLFFKVYIGFVVLALVEIAVFFFVDGHRAVVVEPCSRLCVDFSIYHRSVGAIARAKQ